MKKDLTTGGQVWLIFGWMWNEHEVSINSAKNIVKNFDYKKYSLVLIYRDKNWNFYKVSDISKLSKKTLINIQDLKKTFDIALLMTHGKYGEDWILQSILEFQKIKYCWCRVLSSSLCMDKSVFKDFLLWYKIPQVKYQTIDILLDSKQSINSKITKFKKSFKLPLYVKPSNSGSSVGISKVDSRNKLNKAINEASNHDKKIVIEQWLSDFREIEIAITWNKDLIISQPWELIKQNDFYSYDEKYELDNVNMQIPAKLTTKQINQIKNIASNAYKLCDCSWFARIDFFLHKNKIYLNEINTLPGFTDISMFPMLMKNTWLTYKQLINKIIDLAF